MANTALRRGSQEEGNTDYFTGCPIGGGFIWYGLPSKIPSNCRICDNTTLAIAQFTKLHENLGGAWGASGGNLNLPDLRGRFPRGVDGGAGRDGDRNSRTAPNAGGNVGDAVGSAQGDAIRNITGAHDFMPNTGIGLNRTGAFNLIAGSVTGHAGNPNTGTSWRASFDASNVVPVGSDNRPQNVNVYFVIRVS